MSAALPATAADAAIEGPSYPVAMRWISSLLVAAVGTTGLRASEAIARADLPAGLLVLMALAGLLVLAGWIGILISRTRIDGERIVQQGLWPQQVALADIVQLKLIEAPLLRWCVATRLVVRARSGWPAVYRSADPRVVAAWRLLAYGAAEP